MKRLIILAVCIALYSFAMAQSALSGRVVDDNEEALENALVVIYSADSTALSYALTNASGLFNIEVDSVENGRLSASCLGYQTAWMTLPLTTQIKLLRDDNIISEVEVRARRTFTKQTTTGFVYDLSSLNFTKNQNLLTALKLVPFVDVDAEDNITINGARSYLLYLNGRPFDIGMANVVQVLQSVDAEDVRRVEVVTERDSRFNNDIPVINIITEKGALEGVYWNAMFCAQSMPNAKTGLSVLANAERLDFSISHNYDYRGQREQPIYRSVHTNDYSSALDGRGDGDWHTNVFRALMSCRMDSLNVIYADVHGQINNDRYNTQWTERLSNKQEWNESSSTRGTIECNLIYRNYFSNRTNVERFNFGYRYAYNPDKRSYATSSLQEQTDGGLAEHTLNMRGRVQLSNAHHMFLGVRSIYRKGDVDSTEGVALSYDQSVTYPFISYMGSWGRFNASLNLSCEYEHLSMHNLKQNDFYILPSASLYRSFNGWNLNLNYSRTLQRPTIVMLNPFSSSENNSFSQVGNPFLTAERRNAVSVGCFHFKGRFGLSMSLNYTHTDDVILSFQKELLDGATVVSTYGNIGELNTLTGNLFINWQPISSLVIKMNVNGGLYDLTSGSLELNQSDYTLNAFAWIDYYWADSWCAGASLIHFKQAPEPFATINAITNYSFHLDKNWLEGKLSTSFEMGNMFDEYSELKTSVTNNLFSTERVNYMTARYVGFKLSYTYQRGEKSKLKRDSYLKNSDQESGVL